MRLLNTLLLATMLSAGLAVQAGSVPMSLGYQGTLIDESGTRLQGDIEIVFSLYSGPSATTPFWTATKLVRVESGSFAVTLGEPADPVIDPDRFDGNTYVGIAVGGEAEKGRQKINSVAYALRTAEPTPDAIPRGVIVMWSGSTNDVPDGWALCDGVERTLQDGSRIRPPDLRNRFVMGLASGSPSTGGASTHSHAITVASDGAQSGATGSAGAHSHSVPLSLSGKFYSETSDGGVLHLKGGDDGKTMGNNHKHYTSVSFNQNLSAAQAGEHSHSFYIQAHSHSASSAAASSLPPYYSLAYIMKL